MLPAVVALTFQLSCLSLTWKVCSQFEGFAYFRFKEYRTMPPTYKSSTIAMPKRSPP
jgi:hypothetical protein